MVKRCFDIVVSALGLVLLSPVFALVAVAIRVDSCGPIFYRATRAGRYGKPFRMFKFRSMIAGAATLGAKITAGDDPRRTRIGKALRRCKLDELPQLVNVLKGDMSLVGPRPEDPAFVEYYTTEQRQILNIRPGITCLSSLRFRNEEAMLNHATVHDSYVSAVMPVKLNLDLDYIGSRSFGLDIRILVLTLLAVLVPSKVRQR